ncbi:sugar-binding transcriptional regulator [Paenisporosarcina sp. TG20]|uniref:sugar-binding transcriptional regulator n=1 Tax=Paenisporosarcina sp. TG20 TaxID=1211706 RepID=UPI00030F7DB9|nr:sugar-binding domain-containing protein [Paenisporosarcina sp. TG20]
MNQLLGAQQKLLPEMTVLLQKRYRLLMTIQLSGIIGRRALSEMVHATERETRRELDILRAQGLIEVLANGMEITQEGNNVLVTLKELVHEWSGLNAMELQLEKAFKLARVIIVPGDSEVESISKSLIGQEAAKQLELLSKKDDIIAVTGGSSIAAITNHLSVHIKPKSLVFVAARGGIGENVELQANHIASAFAVQASGTSRTLYLPDHLSEKAYKTMIKEPVIKEMMDLYDNTNIVIHGIGDAKEMALRRNSSEQELEKIAQMQAVGEAFGYYFNEQGKAVHRIRTVGIQLKQLKQAQHLLAVAGGASKAQAILSYLNHAPQQTVLISDEGAAKKLTQLMQKEN